MDHGPAAHIPPRFTQLQVYLNLITKMDLSLEYTLFPEKYGAKK